MDTKSEADTWIFFVSSHFVATNVIVKILFGVKHFESEITNVFRRLHKTVGVHVLLCEIILNFRGVDSEFAAYRIADSFQFFFSDKIHRSLVAGK